VTYGHEAAERLSVAVFAQYAGTPSGRVVVTAGKATICVIKLRSGKGSCRLRSRQLKVGTHHLRATYADSTNFAGSSAQKTVTVVQ
jgi:microcystin-dependent protein